MTAIGQFLLRLLKAVFVRKKRLLQMKFLGGLNTLSNN